MEKLFVTCLDANPLKPQFFFRVAELPKSDKPDSPYQIVEKQNA